jgi:hypothetical protein
MTMEKVDLRTGATGDVNAKTDEGHEPIGLVSGIGFDAGL